MATEIKAPYNVFFGEDGYPLEGGYIFIGLDGLNPLANPQLAYWDSALTIPAANIRTSGGKPVHNGVIGRLYVPGDYSILVQDRNGRTIYSQLSVTFEYSDLLVTESRGTLTRSARAPNSFNVNNIRETGFYAWTNGATTNQPATCAAGDVFMLEVIASLDGAGTIVQRLTDATLSRRFARASVDAGATWLTWKEDDSLLPCVEELTADKVYTAAELDRDKLILLGTGCTAVSIVAGASKSNVRLTFVQTAVASAIVTFGANRTFSIAQNTSQDLVWDPTNTQWRAPAISPAQSHGRRVFGPGALAATVWTVPPGVRSISVTGVGQGGTGAAGANGSRGGGGGGSGAWCNNLQLSVIDGEDITVTLSTSAASTLVSALSGLNLSFGKGGNGSAASAGAAGVGAGGVSNGFAGGSGYAGGGSTYPGGGGGGIGGVGANAADFYGGGGGGAGGGAGGNRGGAAGSSPYLNGRGGSTGPYISGSCGGLGDNGGPGAGGAGAATTINSAGGAGGIGGGGGGGSGLGTNGGAGAGGAPFIVIEW